MMNRQYSEFYSEEVEYGRQAKRRRLAASSLVVNSNSVEKEARNHDFTRGMAYPFYTSQTKCIALHGRDSIYCDICSFWRDSGDILLESICPSHYLATSFGRALRHYRY